MNITLLVVGIVVLIIGIIMLIIGIVVHENNVANHQGVQPWWVWFLIIAGIIIAIVGGFLMAFSSTRKSPKPAVVYAAAPAPVHQVPVAAPAPVPPKPCPPPPCYTGCPVPKPAAIPTSNPYYMGQPASYMPPAPVYYTDAPPTRDPVDKLDI